MRVRSSSHPLYIKFNTEKCTLDADAHVATSQNFVLGRRVRGVEERRGEHVRSREQTGGASPHQPGDAVLHVHTAAPPPKNNGLSTFYGAARTDGCTTCGADAKRE